MRWFRLTMHPACWTLDRRNQVLGHIAYLYEAGLCYTLIRFAVVVHPDFRDAQPLCNSAKR
jgi:hypothetical protein